MLYRCDAITLNLCDFSAPSRFRQLITAPRGVSGNQVRMLPNFVHHMWFGCGGGLAATAYGPSLVDTLVGDGTRIRVLEETMYPFDGQISFTISTNDSYAALNFPLLLRIPEWVGSSSAMVVSIAGKRQPLKNSTLSGFAQLDIVRPCVVRLQFDMVVRTQTGVTVFNGWRSNTTSGEVQDRRRAHGEEQGTRTHSHEHTMLGAGHTTVVPDLPFCTVHRGPLLFALPLEAAAHPHGAQPEWRFALECDAAMMSASYSPNKMEADDWTWPLAFPLTVTVTGRKFEWGSVWDLPSKPVPRAKVASEAAAALTLVPYGASKVFRVSMFPLVEAAEAGAAR